MTLDIPEFKPRRVDGNVAFQPSTFLPIRRRPHGERHALRRREARVCGYCRELVPLSDWDAHKKYCWYGGMGVPRGSPTWFKGCHPNGQPRITDRAWADGDRNMRR